MLKKQLLVSFIKWQDYIFVNKITIKIKITILFLLLYRVVLKTPQEIK